MDLLKQFLNEEGDELYKAALKLTDETSKSDPEDDPYKSMYKARELWLILKEKVEKNRNSAVEVSDWLFLEAAVHLKLGVNYMETEEKPAGETYLKQSISLLESEKTSFKGCNIVQSALNQLGILFTERRNPEKGLEYLLEAESLYKKFRENVGGAPWSVDDLFAIQSYSDSEQQKEAFVQKCTDGFESTYTHTLYYLAQVYGKMDNSELSAAYCQETLHRQLDVNKYQPIDWSMNAATLSQFYFSCNNFVMARHCMASAEFILREAGDQGASLRVEPTPGESQVSLNDRERIPKAWADLYRCWVKYGMALLEHSMDRLFKKLALDDISDHNQNEGSPNDQERDLKEKDKENSRKFFNLELTSVENQITDAPVCTFDEARLVFLKTQTWINSAKEFYILDGHCSDHVEIVRDHSQLFKLLAFFEPDLERQCKMHKRRADMLEAILKQLNRQYYLLVCRQLMFELGEIYSAMLDNKLAAIESSDDPPSDHACKKINQLSRQSIDHFQAFVESYKGTDGKMPEQFQDMDERPVLIAHFYTGRLFSKFIESDIVEHLKNMKRSMDHYNVLVKYCQKNQSAREKVKNELSICEEMVMLLPAKMDKIRAQAG